MKVGGQSIQQCRYNNDRADSLRIDESRIHAVIAAALPLPPSQWSAGEGSAVTLDELRFRLLMAVGAVLYPGYRFKWPQMDWVRDAPFNAYLARFGERNGLNAERR